jgi:parallel beta-helix repeat protein
MEIRRFAVRLFTVVAIAVTLPVSVFAQAQLSVSPTTINVQGSAGTTLPSQTLDISNSGNAALKWSITPPAVSWVTVSQTSGVQHDTVTVSFPSSSSLASGTYQTSLTVRDSNGGAVTVNIVAQIDGGTSTSPPPPPPPPPSSQGGTLYVTCPASPSVTSPDGGSVVVNYTATTDGGIAPISITGNPASGSAFPVGKTSVSVKAQSSDAQTSWCTFYVTVTNSGSTSVAPSPSPSATAVGPQSSIACPAGAVNVFPGASIQNAVNSYGGNTTFCLRSGVFYLTSAITPKTGDVFVGEYGAILDGSSWGTSDDTQGAFRAHNQDIDYVTIRNLVIRRMPFSGIHTYYWMSDHWTIEYNEIASNKIGIEFAPNFTIRNNYIHHNVGNASSSNPAQRGGGYQGFRSDNTTFDSNEIAYNGPEQKVGLSANVAFRNNFVHHNLRDGIWYDTNPSGGSLIEGNRVEDNGRIGIVFESSSGGTIRNNAVRRNPDDGVFISMSQSVQIYGNTLEANFGGIEYFLNCDSLPLGEDVKNNAAYDNTIVVGTQSYAWGGGFSYLPSCSSTQVAAYLNGSKNLTFSRNAYRVPSVSSKYWLWGGWKSWSEWLAMGQDAGGSFSQ